MHKIESNNDLLSWAKAVNTINCNIPDLQDVFVRSTMNELKQYFIDSAQNDKELIVFSISKCMGSSTLLEFITVYSRHKAESYIQAESNELDKRWTELLTNESKVIADKQKLELTIKNLEHRNKELNKDNDILQNTVAKLYNRINELESDIEYAEDRIVILEQFESHIKELLTN